MTRKAFIHYSVPVGSFGIIQEAQMLAYSIGRQLKIQKPTELDLNKSVGPATVVLTTIDKEKVDELTYLISKPINVIGEIM